MADRLYNLKYVKQLVNILLKVKTNNIFKNDQGPLGSWKLLNKPVLLKNIYLYAYYWERKNVSQKCDMLITPMVHTYITYAGRKYKQLEYILAIVHSVCTVLQDPNMNVFI